MIFLYILPVLIFLSSPTKAEMSEIPVITVEGVESGCQCAKKIEEIENNFQGQINALQDQLTELQALTQGVVEAIKVDGEWGPWEDWSECSASCGGGFKVRIRTCNNPEPKHGGKNCTGIGEVRLGCNEEECCPEGMTRTNSWEECTACEKDDNYEYDGQVEINPIYDSADECAVACAENARCNFWSWEPYYTICYMRRNKVGKRPNPLFISGNKACGLLHH